MSISRVFSVVVLLAVGSAAVVAALLIEGGQQGEGAPVTLRVTRDFGAQPVVARTVADVPSRETVLRLLQRNADVRTRYGGGFVQCVNDACGGSDGGSRVDWFYFVNGVEAPEGAAATRVAGEDDVWWDRRDWSAAERVPAVVGAFPQPFLTGTGREDRLPTRVECVDPGDAVCDRVRDQLTRFDIAAAKTSLRAQVADETLRVLVGPWSALREDSALRLLEQGPQASGVFATPRPDGGSIALLGPDGRPASVLRAGGGLVAATVDVGAEGVALPVWAVTGTDAAGVAAAAAAFTRERLEGRFAVAAAPDGAVAPLPVPGAGR